MQNKFNTKLELKFLAETGVFEGYASVFNVVDQVQDKIAPGAFKESLAAHRKSSRQPPLLWQHDAQEPIGAWREMYEDNHGLFVKGDLFIKDIALAKEAYKLLKENVVTGLSIGYRTQESHFEQKGGVRVLTKLDLMEVSLVTFPANEMARVSSVKSAAKNFRQGHFKRRLDEAVAEIKNDIAARRLINTLRKAAADAYNHKEK
jgi:HK97 family phage prohead protease